MCVRVVESRVVFYNVAASGRPISARPLGPQDQASTSPRSDARVFLSTCSQQLSMVLRIAVVLFSS